MKYKLIQGYICLMEGNSVSDQFEAAFIDCETLGEQNPNALTAILRRLHEIERRNPFEGDKEVKGMIDELTEFLDKSNSHE